MRNNSYQRLLETWNTDPKEKVPELGSSFRTRNQNGIRDNILMCGNNMVVSAEVCPFFCSKIFSVKFFKVEYWKKIIFIDYICIFFVESSRGRLSFASICTSFIKNITSNLILILIHRRYSRLQVLSVEHIHSGSFDFIIYVINSSAVLSKWPFGFEIFSSLSFKHWGSS